MSAFFPSPVPNKQITRFVQYYLWLIPSASNKYFVTNSNQREQTRNDKSKCKSLTTSENDNNKSQFYYLQIMQFEWFSHCLPLPSPSPITCMALNFFRNTKWFTNVEINQLFSWLKCISKATIILTYTLVGYVLRHWPQRPLTDCSPNTDKCQSSRWQSRDRKKHTE